MKFRTMIFGFMSVAITAVAQKPTAENQKLIIENQKETNALLVEILDGQKKMLATNTTDSGLEDEFVRMSYAYGITVGESFRMQGSDELDYDAFLNGLKAAHQQKDAKMTNQEAQAFLNEYMSKIMQAKAEVKKAEAKTFLTQNAKRKGVIQTESGLQYEVIKEGIGAKPTATSKVTVHYHGTKLDGTVFDSSVQRNEPASFPLNQVIKGWSEGLQLMPIGSKYKFFIPSELAYGDRGAGGAIGPGELLIFEVELISFE